MGIAADVTRAAASAASVVSGVQIHVDMQLKYSIFGTCSLYVSSSVPTSTVNCACIPAECTYPGCPANCCSCSCQGCECVYDALAYVLHMHADNIVMKCCGSVNCYT